MFWVVSVTGAVGLIALTAAVTWSVSIKPAMRHRVERKHHRDKVKARERVQNAESKNEAHAFARSGGR